MWPRSFSVAAAAVGLSLGGLSVGCSGDGSEPPPDTAPPVAEGVDEPAASEWTLPAGTELRLSIDGREEPMGAKAQLNVQEGVRAVHLAITAADGANDLVILDLQFDGIESSLGPHEGDVGLPYIGIYTVSASLEGRPYHSQAGHIELSLAADGSIEGTFSVELVEEPEDATSLSLDLLPRDQVRDLSGQFMGRWVLRCQSRLPGHQSLILGGEFCESLEF